MLIRRTLLFVPPVAFFLIWMLLLGPTSLGGPASYIDVQGGSMEPTLHAGDLALARKQGMYGMGDVVAFRVPEGEPGEGAIVIHRIVGGSAEEGFVVQGDNKQRPDHWRPKPHDILGEMWFHIPGGGRWLAFLRQPLILGLLAGGLGMFMVLGGGDDKKRTPEVSPAKHLDRARRLWPPPSSTMSLFLTLIVTAAVMFAGRR